MGVFLQRSSGPAVPSVQVACYSPGSAGGGGGLDPAMSLGGWARSGLEGLRRR